MSKPKIYIDGQVGTTGLEIYSRLSLRNDIEIIKIDPDKRKDIEQRKICMEQADLVFLCLPDQASIEAMELIDKNTKVIDASSAHRVSEGWIYGMSELNSRQREAIQNQNRVANPGCHATGFIMSVYPLVQTGIISKKDVISCFSLTGYSGGGKKMISQYESEKSKDLYSPRIYGLTQNHKHLPEMTKICGLEKEPLFHPVVADYYRGMATTISLDGINQETIYECLKNWYNNSPLIRVSKQNEGMIASNTYEKKDTLELIVCGNQQRVSVTALFDNLGKGACGAAIQNMNLMLGFDECEGLRC